jgi:hypothetical protein
MGRIGKILSLVLLFTAAVSAQLPETVALPYAKPGQSYAVQLSTTVSGRAPFTFKLRPGFGELPTGIGLKNSTGLLSGVPAFAEKASPRRTAGQPVPAALKISSSVSNQTAQTYHFIVDVADATGKLVQSLPLALSVSRAPEPVDIGFTASSVASSPSGETSARKEQAAPSGNPAQPPAAAQKDANSPDASDQKTKTNDSGKPKLPAMLTTNSTTITVIGAPASATPAPQTTAATAPSVVQDTIQLLRLKDDKTCSPDNGTPLRLKLKESGENVLSVPVSSSGIVSLTLADNEKLDKGSYLCAYQTTPATPASGSAQATPARSVGSDILQIQADFIKPTFLQDPVAGATTVSVLATPTDSKNAGTANIGLRIIPPEDDKKEPQNDADRCAQGVPLILTGSKLTASTDSQGIASLTLTDPLPEGAQVCAYQTFTSAAGPVFEMDLQLATSMIQRVNDTLDWGRVRAYFAGGVLLANDQNSFSSSSSSPFLLFNLEKTWILPGCSSLNSPKPTSPNQRADCKGGSTPGRFLPGMTTFFETRLTAIPVQTGTSASTTQTTTSNSSSGASLSSQKTARLGVGIYFPWVFTHWYYDKKPNALFWGPLAKVGFDTLTGATSQTLVSGASPVNFNRFYNHDGFGMRLGHYGLTNSDNKSPEILSYLDVTLGPYTNLQSYVCNSTKGTALPGSGCSGTNNLDSRTALYRLDLEGMLKIPKTVMFVGFNANVKARSRKNLDLNLQPNDDLRFLFGVKLDVASIMQKLGVNPK